MMFAWMRRRREAKDDARYDAAFQRGVLSAIDCIRTEQAAKGEWCALQPNGLVAKIKRELLRG